MARRLVFPPCSEEGHSRLRGAHHQRDMPDAICAAHPSQVWDISAHYRYGTAVSTYLAHFWGSPLALQTLREAYVSSALSKTPDL